VEALAVFIKEIGLPTTFAELGISADTDLPLRILPFSPGAAAKS
jgi:glycerol dehydrogenase-like iron-containing ADH family enzyme